MTSRPLRIDQTGFSQLSDNSKNFVLEATDPFHDYPYGAGRVPDGLVASSFTKKYKRALTLTCPFELEAGQTWSVNFFTTSYLYGTGKRAIYDLPNDFISEFIAGDVPLSPLMYYACRVFNGKILNITVGSVPLDDSDLGDNNVYTRVAGCGFEVHDVTPEIYKQGSCTVWKTTSPGTVENLLIHDGSAFDSTPVTRHAGEIPMTALDVASNQSSVTWEAREGAYVVAASHSYQPTTISRYSEALYVGDWNQSAIPQNACDLIVAKLDAAILTGPVFTPTRSSGLQPSGALFDGLSSYTVLRVDLRIAVEFVPGIGSQYNSLASSAPIPDPMAMKLVRLTHVALPAGVKVSENSIGDWFRRVAKIVASVAPTILGLIPQTKALAPVAAMASEIVLRKLNDQPKPKIPLPATPQQKVSKSKGR